jgi:putative ABC transport system permease protein
MTIAEVGMVWREVRREPIVAAAVVCIVGVATASMGAFFAVADGLVFRPLSFVRADELVAVRAPFEIKRRLTAVDVRFERDRMLEDPLIAGRAWAQEAPFIDELNAETEGIRPYQVSSDFFSFLGAQPVLGQWLHARDAGARPAAAVIGHALWTARFGEDPTIIGRIVTLQGQSYRIAGVMPPTFEFPHGANVWSLIETMPNRMPDYVRLSGGVTLGQLAARYPRLDLMPIDDVARPYSSTSLTLLFGATILLVVIAWIQVVSLVFVRTTVRAREIGIRLALGATPGRLRSQFLAEGLCLAAAGVALAWLVVPALTSSILQLLPPEMLRGQYVAADRRTLTFASVCAFVGTVVAVMAPRDLVSRTHPMQTLRGDAIGWRVASNGRTRTLLVFVQLATTAWLLYLAGMAVSSLERLSNVDIGFDANRVLSVTLGRPEPGKPAGDIQARVADLERELSADRRIEAASQALVRPLKPGSLAGTAKLPRQPAFEPITVRMNFIGRAYFRALGVPIVAGREFEIDERDAAIVNETMARRLAAHGPVLGQFVQVTANRGRVVGIVADTVDERPDKPTDPQVFFPNRFPIGGHVLVRVSGPPEEVLPAVVSIAQRTWTIGETHVSLMREEYERATVAYRGRAVLLVWLALVALCLSIVGLIGAIAAVVRERHVELAVRLAVGARPRVVTALILRWALTLVGSAAITGSLAGVAAARWAQTLFFGVRPLDPVPVIGTALALGACALLAAWLPALHASRIDPSVTLKG